MSGFTLSSPRSCAVQFIVPQNTVAAAGRLYGRWPLQEPVSSRSLLIGGCYSQLRLCDWAC
uniref:Uncharacterized protein n=1 Tax=Anguilla anguilla TaxID=7936 RepID=A0A0E9UGW0_ANGAN